MGSPPGTTFVDKLGDLRRGCLALTTEWEAAKAKLADKQLLVRP